MDCPSEEQLIRMKLEGVHEIVQLDFDISKRRVDVFHKGIKDSFEHLINELNLGSKFIESIVVGSIPNKKENALHRKILWWVLSINFSFFAVEMAYGWLSKSMGLIADSLDMLADSLVYGLSLLAVGLASVQKKKIAKLSGYFQMILAFFGLIEVIRRHVGSESLPVFQNMIVISFLALIANLVSLYLIQKANSKEAHMQASMIFTSNDIIINIGVIVAGGLVYFTSSRYPDLVIGTIIFLIVLRGSLRILKLSK